MNELLDIFPKAKRIYIKEILKKWSVEEIRIYDRKKILFFINGQLISNNTYDLSISHEEFNEMLQYITGFSIYSVNNQLKNGYITIDGGHRIGVAGRIVSSKGQIEDICNITSLNIRIAKPIYNIATHIYPYIVNHTKISNILISAPPGVGKTTLLRDFIRHASKQFYKKITIIDERGEIAAMNDNGSIFDLGDTIDVLDMCEKKYGYSIAIRTLSPDIIAVDEICEEDDFLSIEKCFNSGIHIWSTIHANSYEDLYSKPHIRRYLEEQKFDKVIIIDKYSRHLSVYDYDGGILVK